MPRAIRTRVARNVYQDVTGLAAVARVGTRTREKRFPAGTSLRTIQTWIGDTKTALRKEAGPAGAKAGDGQTLQQTSRRISGRFEAQCPRGRAGGRSSTRGPAVFPKRARLMLTRVDIAEQLNLWARRGVAVRTVNKRRNALIQLYVALDGCEAPNPAARRVGCESPTERCGGCPTRTWWNSSRPSPIVDARRRARGRRPARRRAATHPSA